MTTNPTERPPARLAVAPEPPRRARLTAWQRMQAETARQVITESAAVSLADCDARDMGRIVGRLEAAGQALLDLLDTVTAVTP